ncbi:MAG: hypothetical protein C4581_01215 [Nitrospiraceae bacterium]|nr:MAG: hypothetical protein C4581_01215 [Nitrospiraceae bacterium]
MRRKVVLMFLMLAGCLFISNNALAAWTQAKGHSYNQLTLSHYKTIEKFTTIEKHEAVDGVSKSSEIKDTHAKPYRNEEEEFTATKLSYYVEYGLIEDLTVIFSGGFEYVRSNDILNNTGDTDEVTGIGDIILGVRQKISNNVAGGPMSVQLDIKIPEAYDYDNPVDFQALGDGQYDALLKLKYGRGFSWGYAVLDAGYKYRFENEQLDPFTFKPSDTVIVSLSGGYNATPWLSIRAKLDWDKSIGNAKISNEFITYHGPDGLSEETAKTVMILDTLGLEKDSLTAGLALAFTVAKNMQVVASYDWTLDGTGPFKDWNFGPFKSRNSSIGETLSLALAYSH